jgi:ribosome maturation protein SDO1
MTFDQEQVSFNVARLKKAGKIFEIVVDPDSAIAFKQGKEVDMRDVLKSEKVFTDANKGLVASSTDVNHTFGTNDPAEVAKQIINEGEINLTAEYRRKLRAEKKKQIVNLIASKGVDPKTKLPHPAQRIENAFEEAKVKINYFKTAEEQINEILKQLRPVLPISLETKKIMIIIPAKYAGKAYSVVVQFAKPKEDAWQDDGSWKGVIEMPAGLEADFYEKINNVTHGETEISVIE